MNIPLFKVFMSHDVLEPVKQVLTSGFIGQGEQVEKFENILSQYFGNTYINTLNSGTAALHLALRLLSDGIKSGDEILTVPMTCTATNMPILANGFKIKWVDTDVDTCNICVDDLLRKLSPTTKAIMVVHWGGYPCDLDALKIAQLKCQQLYGFIPPIIEDCAHAWGATYKNRLLGNHGNLCAFSFQAIKHFTTGDGGLLVAPSYELYQRAKLLRWYGLDRTSDADFRCVQSIDEWGYKFHMNDINATIGIYNFPYFKEVLTKHRDNARFYNDSLKDVPGIRLLEDKADRDSSYWIYTLKVDNRDGFVKKLKENGISTSRVHDRNDKHPCFKEFRVVLPNTDKLCSEMICIPSGWWVTQEGREYIVDCIKKGW